MTELVSLFQTDLMRWIVILIILDWSLGVVASLVKNTFKLHQLAHYLHDAVLPYVFVFAIVELVGVAQPDLSFIVPASFAFIAATLLGNIAANLGRLGVPVPKILRKE